MKKVFMVHGLNTGPNTSWLPWLMGELKLKDIYACSLAMPTPQTPVVSEWISEIDRHVLASQNDELYLVGHSLGVAAILNFLQNYNGIKISGVVLVSGRCQKANNSVTQGFYGDFDFVKIKTNVERFAVIHGDNDLVVPTENAYLLSEQLNTAPVIIENGGHLNGSAGWRKLPEVLEVLEEMMR